MLRIKWPSGATTLAWSCLAGCLLAACTDAPTNPGRNLWTATRATLLVPGASVVTFVSDPSWSGQYVCLRPGSPPLCPNGATFYDYGGVGWQTDLATIPGAGWIWASGVTGTTASLPAVHSFSKSFTHPGVPVAGSISIGADDFAEVIVNGITVGAVGSTVHSGASALASSTLQTFDIGAYLMAGVNVITVRGANGNFGCGGARYQCNPAGVVFGGTLQFVENRTPVISVSPGYSGPEGGTVDLSGITVSDADGDQLTYTLTFGDTPAPFALPSVITGTLSGTDAAGGVGLGESASSYRYGDNGMHTATLSVVEIGRSPALGASVQFTVTVTNTPPAIAWIMLPEVPVPLGTAIVATASFTDAGWRDTHAALWHWDAGMIEPVGATTACSTSIAVPDECRVDAQVFTTGSNTQSSGLVTAAHTYTAAGVYTVRLSLADDDHEVLGSGAATRVTTADLPAYVVVYDPSAGFVTGGGWFDSPMGACRLPPCAPDGTTVGKAHFGFVSRYEKGSTVPSGNTQFHFSAGTLRFESTVYSWLVISGARAQYKGQGTINDSGSFGFLLTAIDGSVSGGGGADRLRIKIWDLDQPLVDGKFVIVYDNKRESLDDSSDATEIQGGSIVIRTR